MSEELAVLGRAQLLAKLAKHGPKAIDVLAAASERGDTQAASKILAKLLPDLKAVDVTQLESSQARIVIAPRIYIKPGGTKKEVKLPDINISIKEQKDPKRIQEVDITDSLRASPPAASQEPRNLKEDRKKTAKLGRYR